MVEEMRVAPTSKAVDNQRIGQFDPTISHVVVGQKHISTTKIRV